MTPTRFEDLTNRYLDQEIKPHETRRFLSHLSRNPADRLEFLARCRIHYLTLLAVSSEQAEGFLDGLKADCQRAGIDEAVVCRGLNQAPARTFRLPERARPRWSLTGLSVAATLVLLLAASLVLPRPGSDLPTPENPTVAAWMNLRPVTTESQATAEPKEDYFQGPSLLGRLHVANLEVGADTSSPERPLLEATSEAAYARYLEEGRIIDLSNRADYDPSPVMDPAEARLRDQAVREMYLRSSPASYFNAPSGFMRVAAPGN
ncbi:MAG: hypothetical protein ACFE0O_11085 [Opitutales bacterium]